MSLDLNINPAIAKLTDLLDLISELAEPTREVLALLKERLQNYPAPPAGSEYVRTYRLQNSWQEVLILAGDELGKVESVGVLYGPYVQDAEEQAWMHQGRWQTNQMVADDSESIAIAIYEDYLRRKLS